MLYLNEIISVLNFEMSGNFGKARNAQKEISNAPKATAEQIRLAHLIQNNRNELSEEIIFKLNQVMIEYQ